MQLWLLRTVSTFGGEDLSFCKYSSQAVQKLSYYHLLSMQGAITICFT